MRARRAKIDIGPWSQTVGVLPHKVIVEENAERLGGLYLRWWVPSLGNWRRKSLKNVRLGKPLRTPKGTIDPAVEAWAIDEAWKHYRVLTGNAASEAPQSISLPFTLAETEAFLTHPKTGPLPHDTPYRAELLRSLAFACVVWGSSKPWIAIEEEDWTRLMRTRLEGLVKEGRKAVRATEITLARVATIAKTLRRRKKVPASAAIPPEQWSDDIIPYWRGLTGSDRDPEPYQPRHTLYEMRRIMSKTADVDPRFALLMALGAELRLGQAARAMRSDLNLALGQFTVTGVAQKRGTVVDLTEGQRVAVQVALAGYLAQLEAGYQAKEIADYRLFPGGRLLGKKKGKATLGKGAILDAPITRAKVILWFHEAEKLAGIEPVEGRGAYGLRRAAVDAANEEGISRLGLQAHGGWSSTKIPDDIYREKENIVGRKEARTVRARIRGEEKEEKKGA